MKEPKKMPAKKKPKVEEPKPKESSPSAPVIETPVPPQVMDPSAHPDIERGKPATSPDKKKSNSSKAA